jgi:hypothetical protein
LKELTVLGNEQRDNYYEYTINPTGATVFPQRIKALMVHKAITTCDTETVAEYYNPQTMQFEPFRDN